MESTSLSVPILKTLAFFDLFGFPLTAMEVWQYLYSGTRANVADVQAVLEQMPQVKMHQGFYFLVQRPNRIVDERKEKYLIAERKYRRVKRVGKFLARLPFVRLIGVCNSLSYSNARADSDIDLFVVSAAGRVWTARFFCLLFLKLCGLRPTDKNRRDKFCLSFFVDLDHLDLRELALPRDDIYLDYWINQLHPVYDVGGQYNRFLAANSWVKAQLANSIGLEPNLRRVIRLGWPSRGVRFVSELLCSGAWCERLLHWLQLKKMPKALRDKINKDVGVVVRPGVIKLISNDRREAYRNEWVVKGNELVRGRS
ncbi:hypothetical protein HY933_02905 [Candidatus Falkowbacteria bacterium]|nr:hypothetical protein [Candidatus Falkowbacteria bacterium]